MALIEHDEHNTLALHPAPVEYATTESENEDSDASSSGEEFEEMDKVLNELEEIDENAIEKNMMMLA
jgi:hypothetical protein